MTLADVNIGCLKKGLPMFRGKNPVHQYAENLNRKEVISTP